MLILVIIICQTLWPHLKNIKRRKIVWRIYRRLRGYLIDGVRILIIISYIF
jgi:hypothetical protein